MSGYYLDPDSSDAERWPGCSHKATTSALIPGTKRVSRVEENTAADAIELSAQQVQRLNDLSTAAGERHEAANMATVGR